MNEASEVVRAAARLAQYASVRGIVGPQDRIWAYNRVLECCGLFGPQAPFDELDEAYDFEGDLSVLADAAVAAGQAEDSATGRDRIMMRVIGAIMPRPSEVAQHFDMLVGARGPKAATDWFYRLCCDVDYVRRSAIARNVAWTTPTRWGDLEITINKSKPEKDPRDIAAAGAAPVGEAYPACQLCVQNEGYSGRPAADAHGTHPARQNLRIVPIELGGERWGFQYSPYAYFEEHCIAMSAEHRPMHVDRASISCLLDFVDQFPHYFVGSNADLPIVGGSILSHDHFQGGLHEFPMMRAKVVESVTLSSFLGVEAGVLEWPLTVLRLSCDDRDVLLEAAVYVLDAWRGWSDPEVGVLAASSDGTPHNTVTPICRMRDGMYELDLALRCNITSDEHPLGVFHPHEDKWHVKKENIGLIEVMGLAILPPRLEAELESGALTRDEIGRVFGMVLEDAGVFKWDEAGRAALDRFLASL
ncbi:MAG: UDP-glucose--hexose-1-phosphate uridylyltransferase [Atopobiaceae bacterium]|nr:UDP-glucose--hexose-1-phosphate uridylyltransferase [Atopobiaceae bacterium]